MAPSSYAPDEPYTTIIQEETWLQGTLLSNFFFGVQTTLCAFAFHAVFQRRVPGRAHMRIILLAYIATLFAVTTAAQGLLLEWIQMAYVTQRNYPGGPSAFLNNEYSIPVNLASTILVVSANWMMESLLVWRCYVVCSPGERLWRLGVVIPIILLAGVFVTGSLFIHVTLYSATPPLFALAYGISSLLLNLTATGFIAGRLLVYRYQIVSRLGREHGRHYVSIAAVVIESAVIYTSFLVVVIVAYAIGSPATNMLQQVIEQVQTITSMLIILRIARGEGWSTSTERETVSAVVSSWHAQARSQVERNVVRLDVMSTRPDEETSVSVSRKEDERMASLSSLKDCRFQGRDAKQQQTNQDGC